MSNTTRILVVSAALIMVGCLIAQKDAQGTSTRTSVQEVAPPSELALLMRNMAAHADSVKAAIARGDRRLPPAPKSSTTLLTATPTDGMHIDPITYPTLSKDYEMKVAALYKARKEDRGRVYNALVQSCANCHGTHCPGPLMRIKKMYVPLADR